MLTFSCRCAPTHLPVSPLARTQRWRWRVSKLPWLHPPEMMNAVSNVSESCTRPTQICPSPGNWMMPSSLFRCSLWLMGRTLGTVLLWDTWHVTSVTRDTCDTSPDDHVDVVPVHVGAVPRPLGPHRPVGGLGEGTRAAGAANKSKCKCNYLRKHGDFYDKMRKYRGSLDKIKTNGTYFYFVTV